jgi:uncharacterized membrane protein required for colicin V production
MLGFLTILIMLAVTYAFWREGVLSAFVMGFNVLLAGLVAFNFFEPIASELDSMLAGSFLHGYEDSFSLMVLFCATLVFLRWLTNALVRTMVEYHPILQQGGSVVFGLMTGYLVAGFLLCVLQTMPFNEHFLKFEVRPEAQAPGAKLRRFMPPDHVWLALMHRASKTSLAWEDDAPFDPDGSYELRYSRERRVPDEKN